MKVVQFVRLATAQASVYTGVAGQCVIDTGSWVLRVLDGVTPGGFYGLLASSNLSDLTSAATARTNLGLGSAATQNTSAFDAAGAAAAVLVTAEAYSDTGDALRLLKTNNLSDLASAATARTNLGLGSAAVQNTSAFDASGAASAVLATSLQKASNLSDLANVATARTNLSVLSTAQVVSLSFQTLTSQVIHNTNVAVQISADPIGSYKVTIDQGGGNLISEYVNHYQFCNPARFGTVTAGAPGAPTYSSSGGPLTLSINGGPGDANVNISRVTF